MASASLRNGGSSGDKNVKKSLNIQQEGIQDHVISALGFFDVLMIGKTGSGKSTTADKLLIANPGGHCYGMAHEDSTVNSEETIMRNQDLSMWIFRNESSDGHAEANRRLKQLAMHRQLEYPHEEVVRARDEGEEGDSGTQDCELASNETSMVRVLDMPGFNSAFLLEQRSAPESRVASPSAAEASHSSVNLAVSNAGLMQKLIRIQAIADLRFSRILYFLPNRGCLGRRPDAPFIQELALMAYFFGPRIFQNMVAVATLDGHRSKRDAFSHEDKTVTERCFLAALQKAFPGDDNPPNVPPILYISLQDTCEEILEKVKQAAVSNEKLTLQMAENVCTKCSMKIGIFNDEKVVSAFGRDLTQAMPYTESLCHPLMKPKWSLAWRILGHIGNKFARKMKYVWVSDVVCVNCNSDPPTGCIKVGGTFEHTKKSKKQTITVDHSTDLHYIAVAEDEANIEA